MTCPKLYPPKYGQEANGPLSPVLKNSYLDINLAFRPLNCLIIIEGLLRILDLHILT